jgi:putative transposase
MFKGRHFIWLTISSLRDVEEMMAARGLSVDHSTVHRWIIHFSPKLLARFNRRKRCVTGKWHVDETYIKIRGAWMYLYRAIDSVGDTVEFLLSEYRDLSAAKRFFRKALQRHGRPHRAVIDGSQTNREAIVSCDTTNRLKAGASGRTKPIRIRSSTHLNNRIEQDHRRIKRRVRSMLGFKSEATAAIILAGIEMIHMRRGMPSIPIHPSPSDSPSLLHDNRTSLRSLYP